MIFNGSTAQYPISFTSVQVNLFCRITLGDYVEIASNLPTNLRLFFALVEQQPPGYDPQVCTCT